MSLMIAQSAFLCSLFDTVCSASSGPPFAVAEAGPVGLAASFAVFKSTFDFSSSLCTVRAWASSFLCRGVDAKTRRNESRSIELGGCRRRSVWPVLREHDTKPGRKSSRLVNILLVFDVSVPKGVSPSPLSSKDFRRVVHDNYNDTVGAKGKEERARSRKPNGRPRRCK
jgi:hypothetical protein